jgi:Ca-activated chloride channel family protein
MRRTVFLLVVVVCLAAGVFGQSFTQGSLTASGKTGNDLGFCPLKTTSVKTDISGFLARVNVRQEFENSFSEPIEAVYVFPLSQNGAVDSMTMTVGSRVILGKIMRREEARQVYETAKSEGKTASLLDQERANIFTQSVANIMPGERIVIEISYVETLKYEDGAYEFVFPMTVAPRYNPASVKDAAKISPPVTATRAGHDISVEVNLNAGVPVEEIRSSSHAIDQINMAPNAAKITLRSEKVIPNKDFILRYDVTGKRIEDAMLAHRDSRGGFFTLMLQPPDKIATEDRTPKEIVFVLDTSGSMEGFPIEKAKEAMKLSLDGLYPEDTFNIIAFAGDTAILFNTPVPATRANLDAAQRFIEGQHGDGGTEMMAAVKAALDPSDSQEHLRIVCFMTDGEVGNEDEIVAEVQRHPRARVFSFGIGSSVNRSLLDRIAQEGKGEAEYVGLEDDGSKAAKRFYERVRTPLLTDLSIDWNGMPVADIYPNKLTDLFSAKPVIVHGRYSKAAAETIKLKGKVAGQPYERSIRVNLPDTEPANDVLATLWARTKIDDITSRRLNAETSKGTELDKQIARLGLEFKLLTPFTSFVAVEDRVVNQNGRHVTIQVPVALPEGMSPENATESEGDGSGLGDGSGSGSGTGTGYGSVSGSGMAATVDVSSSITSQHAQLLPKGLNMSSVLTMSPPSKPQPRSGQFQIDGSSGSENTFLIDGTTGAKSARGNKTRHRMVSPGVINGKAISMPKPTYPAAATAVNVRGPVNVQIVIDEDGKVSSAAAISGHPLLRSAAVKAALASTFAPTQLSGKPVSVTGIVVYNFNAKSMTAIHVEQMKVGPMKAEDTALLATSEKLHFWIYALVDRLAKGDIVPTPNESIFVHDGKADVRIELSLRSPAIMDQLKALGFEVIAYKGKTVVTGRIAIDKLAALAEIKEVKLVLPKI